MRPQTVRAAELDRFVETGDAAHHRAMDNAALHAAGAEYVRADTDAQNLPMAAAFRRAGYAEFAKRREYGVKLAPLEKSVG